MLTSLISIDENLFPIEVYPIFINKVHQDILDKNLKSINLNWYRSSIIPTKRFVEPNKLPTKGKITP